MIRNVLVMKSGLVLFSREFANTVQQVCDDEINECCLAYIPLYIQSTTRQYHFTEIVGTCMYHMYVYFQVPV